MEPVGERDLREESLRRRGNRIRLQRRRVASARRPGEWTVLSLLSRELRRRSGRLRRARQQHRAHTVRDAPLCGTGARLARHGAHDAKGVDRVRRDRSERSVPPAHRLRLRTAAWREALMSNARLAASSLCVIALVAVWLAPVWAQVARTRDRDPDWVAPAKAAARTNPLPNRPEVTIG